MARARYKLRATDWALRGAVAIVFVVVGMEKIVGASWVNLFAEIGLGQWFRYFTGVVQVTGGVLLVIPATARVGAALLACTMAGAMFVHVFVLSTGPFAAIFPGILLGFIIAAGWRRQEGDQTGGSLLLR